MYNMYETGRRKDAATKNWNSTVVDGIDEWFVGVAVPDVLRVSPSGEHQEAGHAAG